MNAPAQGSGIDVGVKGRLPLASIGVVIFHPPLLLFSLGLGLGLGLQQAALFSQPGHRIFDVPWRWKE